MCVSERERQREREREREKERERARFRLESLVSGGGRGGSMTEGRASPGHMLRFSYPSSRACLYVPRAIQARGSLFCLAKQAGMDAFPPTRAMEREKERESERERGGS